MPKVPEFENKQIKTIYTPKDKDAKVGYRQQAYIMTLCDRRKLPIPDFTHMTKGQAAQLISNMVNTAEVKKISPFKCAKCDYVGKSKADFKEHYDIEHWD